MPLKSFFLLIGLIPAIANAGAPTTAREAITAQQGCYEVTFQYEEVEAHEEGYEFAPNKRSQIIEWIGVMEESDERIVLQHVLVTPPRIKHWKQIWEYEGTEFDVLTRPWRWTKKTLSEEQAQGAWVQTVRGVADNPRYACSAPWVLEGETSWTCRTWAPKPRRDKKREDYTILDRTNTHRIHDKGWVHEQRNTKLRIEDDQLVKVVTEQGNNTYDRIDDSECEKAAAWWAKRDATWAQVQKAWDDSSGPHDTYDVQWKRKTFPLWIHLFWITRHPLAEKRHPRLYQRALKHINRHLSPSALEWSAYDVSLPVKPQSILDTIDPSLGVDNPQRDSNGEQPDSIDGILGSPAGGEDTPNPLPSSEDKQEEAPPVPSD